MDDFVKELGSNWNPNVMPVHVNVKNPFDYKNNNHWENHESTIRKELGKESLGYTKKEINNFSKDKSQSDGLQIYCKECRRQSTKEWCNTLDGFITKILSDLKIYCKKNNIYNMCVINYKSVRAFLRP